MRKGADGDLILNAFEAQKMRLVVEASYRLLRKEWDAGDPLTREVLTDLEAFINRLEGAGVDLVPSRNPLRG